MILLPDYLEHLDQFIIASLDEDIKEGDHTTLSTIPENTIGTAQLIIKDKGILAGVEMARRIFQLADPTLKLDINFQDGASIKHGDIAFTIHGKVHSILKTERLVLNCMQRMSGIATLTNIYTKELKGLKTKILDTRKTTPCFRMAEKWAVLIGGGINHRFGLYDMILIKDNHIDYAGGIIEALTSALEYCKKSGKQLKIEVEVRNMNDVQKIITIGSVDRVMMDNFTPEDLKTAVDLINGSIETEASGGITLSSIRSYAECGVDYISSGAITHSAGSLDMSLKALI